MFHVELQRRNLLKLAFSWKQRLTTRETPATEVNVHGPFSLLRTPACLPFPRKKIAWLDCTACNFSRLFG